MTLRTLDLIDSSSASRLLSISRKKLEEMARNHLVPCYELPCGEFVFSEHELMTWLQKQRVPGRDARRNLKLALPSESVSTEISSKTSGV